MEDDPEVSRRFGVLMFGVLLLMGGGFFVLFVVLDRSGEPLHDRTRRMPGGTIQRELDATPLIMNRDNLKLPPQPTIPKPPGEEDEEGKPKPMGATPPPPPQATPQPATRPATRPVTRPVGG